MVTILVVVADNAIRKNTCELLELAGYEGICADNGNTGLMLAIEKIPDIILCDTWLPDVNGYKILSAVKKRQETAHIPFIFCSANIEPSEVIKGLELGAVSFIGKPYTK